MKFERKKGISSFRDLLPDLIEKLNLKKEFSLEILKGEWGDLVGPIIAAHSWPQRIDGNTLFVFSDHSVYTNDLFMRKRHILAKLNSLYVENPITDIKIYTAKGK